MLKKEIKGSIDEKLIVDYINTYANFLCNFNLNRGTKMYFNHLKDLGEELVKRGILSQESINYLQNV